MLRAGRGSVSNQRLNISGICDAHLGMRKAMQKAACLDLCNLKDDITIATTGCCSHDILVEWEWDEGYKNEQIY